MYKRILVPLDGSEASAAARRATVPVLLLPRR